MDLSDADLRGAQLRGATLIDATLCAATLFKADLRRVHLIRLHLRAAQLSWADLSGADLREANLSGATLDWTLFIGSYLADTKGLDSVTHRAPSTLDHVTFKNSGDLPLVFLRGIGLPDWLIESYQGYLGSVVQFLLLLHQLQPRRPGVRSPGCLGA